MKTNAPDWMPDRWRDQPRWRLWYNMLRKDHCLVRLLVPNAHRVTDELWRAGQLLPHSFAIWRRRGIRTVLNLRGRVKFATWVLAKQAAERQGLQYLDFGLRSRALPSREELLGLLDLLDRAAYPILLHCKSGSDRTGLAAGIYLIHRLGLDAEAAQRQLSLKYLHLRKGKAGVLRLVLTSYGEAARRTGISFRDWVTTGYDAERLAESWGEWNWRSLFLEQMLQRE